MMRRLGAAFHRCGLVRAADRAGVGDAASLSWHALGGRATLRAELDVRRDARRLRRSYPFLREQATATGDGRVLFIVNLGNWIMQAKAEAMLAKALELRGLAPIVLTSRHNHHTRRVFQALGISRFVDLADFERPGDGTMIRDLAARALGGLTTFPQVMAFQHGGVHVGRHVLSTICRTLRHGTPDLADAGCRRSCASWCRRPCRPRCGPSAPSPPCSRTARCSSSAATRRSARSTTWW
jgi:hypothetical protein